MFSHLQPFKMKYGSLNGSYTNIPPYVKIEDNILAF